MRIVGQMLRGHGPAPAVRAETRPSGGGRSQELGSRRPPRDPTRERRDLESRSRSRDRGRNAAILPEIRAIRPETDLHNLQKRRRPSTETLRLRNWPILPETLRQAQGLRLAEVDPETALHNVQNSPSFSPERRRDSAILPETRWATLRPHCKMCKTRLGGGKGGGGTLATLPETTARHSETDVHNVQNSPPQFPDGGESRQTFPKVRSATHLVRRKRRPASGCRQWGPASRCANFTTFRPKNRAVL